MAQLLTMKKHLISIHDLSTDEILSLVERARHFSQNKIGTGLQNKIVASLFFEPSTRTRLSFESAVKYQGGQVVGFASSTMSSVSKGECIEDTIRTVMAYTDAIVIRHPEEGAAQKAMEVSTVPIINAGDGANEHPTQTLLDIYTIAECQGTIEGITIGIAGDLKYGRTVHSLVNALAPMGVHFVFIAPEAITIPQKYLDMIDSTSSDYVQSQTFEPAINELDILYMTRTQKERFESDEAYNAVKDSLILTIDKLRGTKQNLKVMHPLPRVNELDHAIDSHPSAYYFQQVQNGLYMRQALLEQLLT